ncbi:MAG: TetR family transcriptional regulator [Bdellovibrionia bacterium]
MELSLDRSRKRRKQAPRSSNVASEMRDTREILIQTAKTLFAEKGFDGTTVKDIADRAKVNISLISYHFQGKERLYRTCLELLGNARLAVAVRVLQKPQSADEFRVRLEMFVVELLSGHIEEPELSRIVARECDMGFSTAQDIFKSTFLKIFETLVNFFKSAQKQGIVRKDLDMDIVVGLLFSGLIQVGQKDQLNEHFFGRTIKDPKHFSKVVRHSLSFYFNGCLENMERNHPPIQMPRVKIKDESK